MKESEISEVLADAAGDRNNKAAGFLAKHLYLEKSEMLTDHSRLDLNKLDHFLQNDCAVLEQTEDAVTFLIFDGFLNTSAAVIEARRNGSAVLWRSYCKGVAGGRNEAEEALVNLLSKFLR